MTSEELDLYGVELEPIDLTLYEDDGTPVEVAARHYGGLALVGVGNDVNLVHAPSGTVLLGPDQLLPAVKQTGVPLELLMLRLLTWLTVVSGLDWTQADLPLDDGLQPRVWGAIRLVALGNPPDSLEDVDPGAAAAYQTAQSAGPAAPTGAAAAPSALASMESSFDGSAPAKAGKGSRKKESSRGAPGAPGAPGAKKTRKKAEAGASPKAAKAGDGQGAASSAPPSAGTAPAKAPRKKKEPAPAVPSEPIEPRKEVVGDTDGLVVETTSRKSGCLEYATAIAIALPWRPGAEKGEELLDAAGLHLRYYPDRRGMPARLELNMGTLQLIKLPSGIKTPSQVKSYAGWLVLKQLFPTQVVPGQARLRFVWREGRPNSFSTAVPANVAGVEFLLVEEQAKKTWRAELRNGAGVRGEGSATSRVQAKTLATQALVEFILKDAPTVEMRWPRALPRSAAPAPVPTAP